MTMSGVNMVHVKLNVLLCPLQSSPPPLPSKPSKLPWTSQVCDINVVRFFLKTIKMGSSYKFKFKKKLHFDTSDQWNFWVYNITLWSGHYFYDAL